MRLILTVEISVADRPSQVSASFGKQLELGETTPAWSSGKISSRKMAVPTSSPIPLKSLSWMVTE